MKHYGYPSIPVFRTFLSEMINRSQYVGRDQNGDPIFDRKILLPTIELNGAVKLHGSNASIAYTSSHEYYSQSREIILTEKLNLDNFYQFSNKVKAHLENVFKSHMKIEYDALVIYGEWCGKGVQSGVAVSSLDKMYVLFGIACVINDERIWLDNSILNDFVNTDLRIFNIYNFDTYKVDLNLADPEASIERLSEITASIEAECPVGKYFGVSGAGEGAVYFYEDKFNGPMPVKLKGIKHSTARVKKIVEIDPVKVKSIEDFVYYAVSDNRLNQGISYLNSIGMSLDKINTGHFVKWINTDIIKEESDVLLTSNLTHGDVKFEVSKKATSFYLSKVGK